MSPETINAGTDSAGRLVRHSHELRFTIVAEPHEHWVDYTLFDIEGWGEGEVKGIYDKPLWHKAGAPSRPSTVKTLDEAEPYLHGTVKWDGCSNWHFDEQERTMLHGCRKSDVQRFGDAMAMCWEWTADLCPAWDR
jgi:hypothetical protein